MARKKQIKDGVVEEESTAAEETTPTAPVEEVKQPEAPVLEPVVHQSHKRRRIHDLGG